MGADSPFRRMLKRALAPVLNEATYSSIQAVAKARDITSGSWTEPELALCHMVLRDGESAIDIGANFGLWSYHMARAVGRSGQVHAFEPVPFTARTFRKVARRLGFSRNVTLHEAGCGEQSGQVEFTVPVMNSGAISAGLVHMGRNDARPGKEIHARFDKTKTIVAKVVTIDEAVPDISRLALLKCDIEGADLFAMRGARRTLETHKPVVVIEITPWFLEGFGLRVADVTDFFEQLGYRCFHFDDDGRLTPASSDTIVEDNWVFIHPDREDRLAGSFAS
jgi:FkbM family methyltransferase